MAESGANKLQAVFDVEQIRRDFPILAETVNGHPLVYLDNAATTQKPFAVIKTLEEYYRKFNANIHRGVHSLSQQATEAYENARETVRAFINAGAVEEIIFTRGTTESINLVASCLGRLRVQAGDEILIAESEHHSNIVPWQFIAEQYAARLLVAPINDAGELELEAFRERLSSRTRIVAVGHISNALGTINPVKELTTMAHDVGAVVLIDGAQAMAHTIVDVQDIGCDFYAFSGHKVFGPTGVGVLWGRAELLEEMPPYQGGGEMIKEVRFERTQYNDLPYKFEAGTPNIAGGIGLGSALEYLNTIDFVAAMQHEDELLRYATAALSDIDNIQLVGTAAAKTGVLSFSVAGVHPHDLGLLIDHHGVAVRTGHHCAMPVMQRYGLSGTVRASLALYNTNSEIDRFISALKQSIEMLA